jgi:hypothetical protein
MALAPPENTQRVSGDFGKKGQCKMSMFRNDGIASEDEFADERALDTEPVAAPRARSAILSRLLREWPYVTMLLLAFLGVTFSMPVAYWVIMTPVFGIICIVAGWGNVKVREERIQLVYALALDWLALIFAIVLLYNYSIEAVVNTNARSLALMTLLALGTFVAGVQARVWRICAVGGVLFVTVPVIGWLDQSIMFLAAVALLVLAIVGLTRWMRHRRRSTV